MLGEIAVHPLELMGVPAKSRCGLCSQGYKDREKCRNLNGKISTESIRKESRSLVIDFVKIMDL